MELVEDPAGIVGGGGGGAALAGGGWNGLVHCYSRPLLTTHYSLLSAPLHCQVLSIAVKLGSGALALLLSSCYSCPTIRLSSLTVP